jgi:phage-related protein
MTGVLKGVAKTATVAFSAASATATAFVSNALKSAVQGFGEYEQLVGGVDTLFKDASDEVQKNADMAFKTAQISANDYMQTVTSFSASLIQSLGGDTRKAAQVADKAVIDMADNANKMGTDISMIQNAYQGFAKQNFMMLDNLKLGYSGTRTEMQRLLKDAEAISGVHYDISSFSDMVEAIHVVQQNLGITGTSAEEASKTIQGSLNSMKSAWSNLVVGLANDQADFNGLMGQFVDSAGTFLENVIPVIEATLPKIGELVNKLVPIIVEKLPGLIQSLLPPFINVVTQIAIVLIREAPNILTMILNGFLAALPDIVTAIVEALPQIIDAIIQFLTNPDTIQMLIEAAVQLFMALVMAVPQILGGLIQAFGNLVGNLWNGITSMFGEFAANFGKFISDIFKGAINGVLTFIENFINAPIDLLNGFIDIINGAFGWIGVNLGRIDRIQLPRLAQGGFVDGATTAMIGEDGAEAVLPLENNTDNWAGLLAQTLVAEMEIDNVGTGGLTIEKQEFIINNQMDAEEIGRVMMQSIRRSA